MNLSRAEIQKIADEAADRAVKRVLRDIGVDTGAPFEMRRDLEFLNAWRRMCETSRTRAIGWVVIAVLTGALTVFLLGFKSWLR